MWHTWWQLMRSLTFIFRSSSLAAAVFAFNTHRAHRHTILRILQRPPAHFNVESILVSRAERGKKRERVRSFDKSIEVIIQEYTAPTLYSLSLAHTHAHNYLTFDCFNRQRRFCVYDRAIIVHCCFGFSFCFIQHTRASAKILWNKRNEAKWNKMKLKLKAVAGVWNKRELTDCNTSRTWIVGLDHRTEQMAIYKSHIECMSKDNHFLFIHFVLMWIDIIVISACSIRWGVLFVVFSFACLFDCLFAAHTHSVHCTLDVRFFVPEHICCCCYCFSFFRHFYHALYTCLKAHNIPSCNEFCHEILFYRVKWAWYDIIIAFFRNRLIQFSRWMSAFWFEHATTAMCM